MNAVARAVRAAYVRERRLWYERRTGQRSNYTVGARWDGGEDDLGRPTTSIWQRIAQFLLGHSADPEQFVRAQFLAQHTGTPPSPGALMSRKCLEAYEKLRDKEPEELRLALQLQRERAREEIEQQMLIYKRQKYDAWLFVLNDASLPFSALFRYCLARSINKPDFDALAAAYREAAEMELRRSPSAYMEAWGDWLPDRMKKLAGKLTEVPNG